jgi:hypothetical protein
VEYLFRPNLEVLNSSLNTRHQDPRESACDYVETLKTIHADCWAPLPKGRSDIGKYIYYFRDTHADIMLNQFSMSTMLGDNVDFTHLVSWAKHADDRLRAAAVLTRSQTSAMSNPQQSRPVSAQAQAGAVQTPAGKGKKGKKGKGKTAGTSAGAQPDEAEPFNQFEINCMQAVTNTHSPLRWGGGISY